MRCMFFCGLVLASMFVFILSMSQVVAIGVSPPSHIVHYQEGKTVTFEMYIIGATNPVEMTLQGDFVEDATLSIESFEIVGDKQKVSVSLTYPAYETLTEFGPRRLEVVARELPSHTGSFGATTAVKHIILIHVPLPGQYAELTSISIPSVNEGLDTTATIKITNRGTDYLDSASLRLLIFDMASTQKTSLSFPDIVIPPQTTKELIGTIQTASFSPGKYNAEAIFSYGDDKVATKDVLFFVGTTDIELVNYTSSLTAGKVNKLELRLQSLWGSALRNIRVSYKDMNNREQFLPVLDLNPFEERVISTFIEIPELNQTEWITTLSLDIPDANRDGPKQIPITFTIEQPESENSVTFPWMLVSIVFAVVVLFIGSILITLHFAKRNFVQPEKPKKKQAQLKKEN